MTALLTEGLCRSYTSQGGVSISALRDVSLSVAPGQVVVLLGKSGSGKTTLLNLLAGLDKPSAGRIEIDGQDLSTLGEKGLTLLRRRRIGFLTPAWTIPALKRWTRCVTWFGRIPKSIRPENRI